jgi:hypothetical protein
MSHIFTIMKPTISAVYENNLKGIFSKCEISRICSSQVTYMSISATIGDVSKEEEQMFENGVLG